MKLEKILLKPLSNPQMKNIVGSVKTSECTANCYGGTLTVFNCSGICQALDGYGVRCGDAPWEMC